VKKFLEVQYPDEWADLDAGLTTIEEFEKHFKENDEAAKELKDFAEVWQASYAPLFQFRESLFENLKIHDPKGLLLDESEETILDPIHLLRYYDFAENGEFIELINRPKVTYEISFQLRYLDSAEEFKNKEINKLTAFKNCRIERSLGGAIAPTPLLKELEKNLLPGVIISTEANQWVIISLRKQGIASYPISVSCNDFEKKYTFFPGLSGILAIAMYGIQLKLPDNENFYVV